MVEPQPLESTESAEHTAPGDAESVPSRLNGEGPVNGRSGASGAQELHVAMKPVLQGLDALARAQFEQADMLGRVERALRTQDMLPKMLAETKQALDQKNSLNRAMFDALHAELKSYKDAFLLESLLRPVIRDLIMLFDDISEVHRQLHVALATHEKRGGLCGGELILFESVLAPVGHLEHNRDVILEILERLDVTRVPSNTGKLDKRVQKAVSVELVEDPEQDQQVVKIVKAGFQWKERLIRPEEVIIKKWQEGYLAAIGTPAEKS
jgi:hypothetical protein